MLQQSSWYTASSPCSVAPQGDILERGGDPELIGRLTDPLQLPGHLSKTHFAAFYHRSPWAGQNHRKSGGTASINVGVAAAAETDYVIPITSRAENGFQRGEGGSANKEPQDQDWSSKEVAKHYTDA